MRSKRGITLVSLVVTIIVLIILAGVSINLTLGENGIITIAKKARENMELAKIDEERQLNELYMQMEQDEIIGGNSYDAIAKLIEFKREIASTLTDMGIETAENADASTMSSNIRSLAGASSADKVSYDNTNSGLTSTHVQGAVDELNDSLDQISSEQRIDGYSIKVFTETVNFSEGLGQFNTGITNYSEMIVLPQSFNAATTILTVSNIENGEVYFKTRKYDGTNPTFSCVISGLILYK